jgi:hypothetical protein
MPHPGSCATSGLARSHDVDFAVATRFLLGLDGPRAGDDEIGLRLCCDAAGKVQRHDAVLADRTALQEQDAEILGHRSSSRRSASASL